MYVDTSVLVKLFVREPESDFYGKLVDGRMICSSVLAYTEVWSALLAREVGKWNRIPVAEDVLRRARDTAPQISLTTADEHSRNMEGAFECTGDVARARLLLVDDVITTGSTMSACAAPLVGAFWAIRSRHGE